MSQTSLINQVQNRIQNKDETIADSIVLLRPELSTSITMDTILVPTHNIYSPNTFGEVFMLAKSLLSLVHKYPHAKIICAVPSYGCHHGILSRFTHISGVIKIDRLMHLCNLIDAFKVTHICHVPTFINTWNINNFKPVMKVKYQDALYSHSIISNDVRTLLSITYFGQKKEMQSIINSISKIKTPYIIMSNIPINEFNCPNIIHNGYIASDTFNPSIDEMISLATGLLQSHLLIPITPQYYNLFDYMYKYIH